MAKKRMRPISIGWAVTIIVLLVAIGVSIYGYDRFFAPAEVVPPLANNDVTLTFSDRLSGTVLNPAVTLTGVNYAVKKTASGGEAKYTAVPTGTYTLETELTGIYEIDALQESITVESATKEISFNFLLDNIGTFSWGDTSATGAPALDENNQTVTVTLYLNNTAKDTVIKNLKVKLEANIGAHENISIDKIECTSHAFEEDDVTAEKWIISGITIGNIVGEESPTVVTYRLTLDVGAAADALVLTASVQDLNGTSPEISASKTITLTAS